MSKNIYVWPALFMLDLRGNIENCLTAMPEVIKEAAKEYRTYDRFELDYFGDKILITEKIDIEGALKHFGELWKRHEVLYDLKEKAPTEKSTVKHKGGWGERVDTAAKRACSEAREYVNEYRLMHGEVGLYNVRHIFTHNEREYAFNPWKEGEAQRMTEAFFADLQEKEEKYLQSDEHKKLVEEQAARQKTTNEMVENLGAFFEMDDKDKMAWIREFLEHIDYRSTEIDYEKIFKTFQENGYNTRSTLESDSDLIKAWTELKAAYTKYMTQRFFEVLHFRLRSTGNPIAGTGVPPSVFDHLNKFKELE